MSNFNIQKAEFRCQYERPNV